jgi:type VI secretion system protein ImpJ
MKSLKPIYWHQGLFLQPQHFQLTDVYLQALSRPFMDAVLPHGWGIREIDIQSSALGRGTGHINGLTAIFQDGTYVQFPGNAVIRPRSFEEDWTARDRPLTLYAGLRRFRENASNVTVIPHLEADGGETRFVTLPDPEEVRDLYGNGPEAQVRTLYFNVRLFWDSEISRLEHYSLIPVAQVLWDGGAIKVSQTFVPPSLSLSASRSLAGLAQEIRNECASRARQLEEFKAPGESRGEGAESGGALTYLLALRTLNRYVPLLYHYTESDPLHPWFLYGILRQMVGELSTFSDRVNLLGESDLFPEPLPPYNHEDLWGCLTRAQTVLFTLLNDLTIGPDLLVRLVSGEEGFDANLTQSFFSPRTRYYLAVRADEEAEAVVSSFLDTAKVGTPSLMSTLIRRALPGVEVSPMGGPPPGLPRRLNTQYFKIEIRDRVWEAIRQEEAIQVFWPTAPEGTTIDLIGVK